MNQQDRPRVQELVARSNRLGSDPRNTNYAGGNTSAKGEETDPVVAYARSGYGAAIVADRVGGQQAGWGA